jgi:gamma-glutamyltranspeptidase
LYVGTLPVVSLLEDAIAYAEEVFDIAAKTISDLQRLEQLKRDRGEQADWRRLGEREVLLSGFLRNVEDLRETLTDIRRADFVALTLVWSRSTGKCDIDLLC